MGLITQLGLEPEDGGHSGANFLVVYETLIDAEKKV